MKLLVYETTHHETLPALLDLAELYFSCTTVMIQPLSFSNLTGDRPPEEKWPHANFIVQRQGQSNRNFIKETFKRLQEDEYSHFHISTLDNNLLYFAWLLLCSQKKQFSLSVQAINEYCAYRYNNLRDITESIAKKIIHRRIRAYRVFFPLMVELLQKRLPHSKAYFIPSRFFSPGENRNEHKVSSVFRIVIPGAVDPIRRDYAFVTDFLKKFLKRGPFRSSIELVILGNAGSPFGGQVVARLNELKDERFSLVYYTTYISQAEYERQIRQADILWAPIRLNTYGIRMTPELYGQSTATGLTADLMFASTPALIPKGFEIPRHYERALIPYQSEDELALILERWIQGQQEDLAAKIRDDFSFFTKINFSEDFRAMMSLKDQS